MKIDKSVRELPWPPRYAGRNRKRCKVYAEEARTDKESFLVVTVCVNPDKTYRIDTLDFRLICSKEQRSVAVFYGGKSNGNGKSQTLEQALSKSGTEASPSWIEPEYDQGASELLISWLGKKKDVRNRGLMNLEDWTREAVEFQHEKRMKAKATAEEIEDSAYKLCPDELPDGLIDFIHRRPIAEDDVLIYKHGNCRGLCYRCGQTVRTTREHSFKQHQTAICPNCGREVRCFKEGGDSFAADYVEDVATIQLGKDKQTVFIRQWHLNRDPTAKWEDIPQFLEEVARYAVRGESVAKWQKEAKSSWFMRSYRYHLEGWTRVQNVVRVYDGQYYFYLPKNWRKVVAGTSLQYIDLAGYEDRALSLHRTRSIIRFILDWPRYPAIEKLWKAGYMELVHERQNGLSKEFRFTVLWNKNSIADAVRFPARLLKLKTPKAWSMEDMQRCRELWSMVQTGRIKENEIPDILAIRDLSLDDIKNALGHASIHKITRYIERCIEVEKAEKKREADKAKKEGRYYAYMDRPDAPHTYRDYLADCIELGLDLNDKAVLFPPNLPAAHARTIALVKHKANAKLQAAFDKQVVKLNKLAFDNGELLIRPAASADELVEEGAYLHHCVGGYANSMAEGKTAILLIRRMSEPTTPYYTMEFKNGSIVQCRTQNNVSYQSDEMVASFVAMWLAFVAKTKRQKVEVVA